MTKYQCKFCGKQAFSVASLVANGCPRHPRGANRGKHTLYEGDEKQKYTCKYCGRQVSSIASLTIDKCSKHPDGANKGYHEPAL